jgi:hypothetical protein
MAWAVIAAAFQEQTALMVAKDDGANSASFAACRGVSECASVAMLGTRGARVPEVCFTHGLPS